MATDYRIYRWYIDPTGPMDIVIPPETPIVEALELGPRGLGMRRMVFSADGSPTTFPELEIWDDPTRSPSLARSEPGWQEENTDAILHAWEEERLGQFQEHCFKHYYSMQVVYRVPPTISPVHFHQDGQLVQGWRIEMVAAFFAGFKPQLSPPPIHLRLYNPESEPRTEPPVMAEVQPEPVPKPRIRRLSPEFAPVGRKATIVEALEALPTEFGGSPETKKPEPPSKPRLHLVPKD